MKNEPKEITLMLSVSGGGDAFGPFFATLTLNRASIEKLLNRADVFHAGHKLDLELYQTTYFDYMPEFIESGKSWDSESAASDKEKVEEIFDEERYPTDGWRPAAPGEVPETGNVRRDYCKLVVAGSMSQERPGMVDYHWVACIKHTSIEIETCEMKEEELRALLGQLAPSRDYQPHP